MYLREVVEVFSKTRNPELLRQILKEHGKKGFSIACRAAGISRGAGKRLLGIYSDNGVIAQITKRAAGLKTSKW